MSKIHRRAGSIWVSNKIRVCSGFVLLSSVIGYYRKTCSHAFSCAWHHRVIWRFASISVWFITLFASVVIGWSNNFGFDFGFTTLNRELLYSGKYCKSSNYSFLRTGPIFTVRTETKEARRCIKLPIVFGLIFNRRPFSNPKLTFLHV